MWSDKNTVQIHMELTNACNAACPMCVRFHNNSPLTRPDLEIGQITLELFKKYIPNDILTQINLIMFCGVHGDPGVARDTYEICKHIAETSPNTNIMMNSNGGMRTPSWWSKMGKLFSKKKHWLMTFSIDGLENSNHLYRRNVEWNKLEANVKAFTQHNPRSAWDFLIFAHNEHQLEEAKARCKEFNITELSIIKIIYSSIILLLHFCVFILLSHLQVLLPFHLLLPSYHWLSFLIDLPIS